MNEHAALPEGCYHDYVYAYPHKTAYRSLPRPVPLNEVWRGEDKRALFLYFHVPFCRSRCGYCNLFSLPRLEDTAITRYLDALSRQAECARTALGTAHVERLALGGGTPTLLAPDRLEQLFRIATLFDVDPRTTDTSVEAAPAATSPMVLNLLRSLGVRRISLGVQSFVDAENEAVGRKQTARETHAALARIRAAGFPTLNIDLIYGLPRQDARSWRQSLIAALEYRPDEIYLYPLYVRPGTGLARSTERWPEARLALYHEGRDLLLEAGYVQDSMRLFRRSAAGTACGPSSPRTYVCQEDGMLGLGCGARSYTRKLHYSFRYAVSVEGVRRILQDYSSRTDFSFADHGIEMDDEDQRRRYVLKSLLKKAGLQLNGYRRFFGTEPEEDLPQLRALRERGWAVREDTAFRLTDEGLERSDAIGPWLYSARVQRRMREYIWW